jgi:SAM-dependent methyltransferase
VAPARSGAVTGLWRLLRGRLERTDVDLEAAKRRPRMLADPGPVIADYVWRHRADLARWLRGMGGEAPHLTPAGVANDLAHLLVRWLQGRNQFLDADPGLLARVRGAYAASIAEATDLLDAATDRDDLQADLGGLFERHHARLGDLLTQAYGGRLRDAPWSQYSPGLQMAVLRLDEPLAGPILDIGCGADGALTLALRAAGHEVTGFDRDAQAPGLSTGDWLGFDYGEARWGTAVSHLGFSLHFLHQHLAGASAAFDYARSYRRILAGLKPGGVFAYAPSLPFIEDVLPPAFVADRFAWDRPGDDGAGLLSSSRVTRR